MALSVVILAAGKGKRMASNIPKVMHRVGGLPMLERVVRTAQSLNPTKIHVVYGNGGSTVKEDLAYLPVNWVHQEEQLGTGHAVMQALPACNPSDQVLVLYGDVPLISASTLQQLLSVAPVGGVGVLVARFDNPTGFGRIVRDKNDEVIGIVEERDASTVQKAIHEINTGIVTAPAELLQTCLPQLSNQNAQKEYYLTDVISLSVKKGLPIKAVQTDSTTEVSGVNDPWQLANVERHYQSAKARSLAISGVIIMDPKRLDIRGDVSIEPTVQLDVNVVLSGQTSLAAGCVVGANVCINNAKIGPGVTILPNSVIDGATVEGDCVIGPFARIRPGTVMKKGAKVGNFVEVKKTILGEGSKASHLTYLGDAVIGKSVNIGAGTITCNYDGVNKWVTEIGDFAFIGSNTSLVAPIKIGQQATIAAGSTVTKYAPENQLTITRAKQMTISGWKRPTEKKSNHSVVV